MYWDVEKLTKEVEKTKKTAPVIKKALKKTLDEFTVNVPAIVEKMEEAFLTIEIRGKKYRFQTTEKISFETNTWKCLIFHWKKL
jgi:hypothetical protein